MAVQVQVFCEAQGGVAHQAGLFVRVEKALIAVAIGLRIVHIADEAQARAPGGEQRFGDFARARAPFQQHQISLQRAHRQRGHRIQKHLGHLAAREHAQKRGVVHIERHKRLDFRRGKRAGQHKAALIGCGHINVHQARAEAAELLRQVVNDLHPKSGRLWPRHGHGEHALFAFAFGRGRVAQGNSAFDGGLAHPIPHRAGNTGAIVQHFPYRYAGDTRHIRQILHGQFLHNHSSFMLLQRAPSGEWAGGARGIFPRVH